MLTYESAKASLFDSLGEELRILKAWETEDAFIFSACDMDEKDPDFGSLFYEVFKGVNDFDPPVDIHLPADFEFSRIEHARRIV